MKLSADTFTLLGLSVYTAQKVEFGLYGLAAHASHLPEIRSNKRFAALTPDLFLSKTPGESATFRATLGELYRIFGERLAISSAEFDEFLNKRNIVVHSFWREVRDLRGRVGIPQPDQYLLAFIELGEKVASTLQGLLSLLQEAAAENEGRSNEFVLSDLDVKHREAYIALARRT